jgi:hypothetical protein
MTQEINLKELEKKAWTSTFEDGITDIGIGLILVVTTICQIFNESSPYLYPLFIVPALFIIVAKKYITAPRMGLVKFSKKRTRKTNRFMLIMTTLLVFLVTLTLTAGNRFLPELPITQVINNNGAIIVGAIVFIIPCSIAYFLNWDRMYFYAVLYALSFALNEITIADTGVIASGAYAWLISGIIMIVIGVVYLVRFLCRYTLPEKEAPDVIGN